MADVRAEKEMKWERYLSGIPLSSLSDIARVFPVPVGPTHNTYTRVRSHVFNACVLIVAKYCYGEEKKMILFRTLPWELTTYCTKQSYGFHPVYRKFKKISGATWFDFKMCRNA